MKRLTIFATIIILFLGCKKEKTHDTSACALAMKERFKDELICTTKPIPMEGQLFKGTYKGEVVYFPNIVCASCNTVPPTSGYTCDDKKVTFEKFEDVKNVKAVYSSCTNSFSE